MIFGGSCHLVTKNGIFFVNFIFFANVWTIKLDFDCRLFKLIPTGSVVEVSGLRRRVWLGVSLTDWLELSTSFNGSRNKHIHVLPKI